MEKDEIIDDKELDEFIAGELQKDITQEDTIDPSVEQHIQEMGFLWDRVQRKFKNDKICFSCKIEMDFENDAQAHLVEAGKVEKGVIAFLSICKKCFKEQMDKMKESEKGEKK